MNHPYQRTAGAAPQISATPTSQHVGAGDGLPLARALPIAEAIAAQLAPYCERICIAGSIRRRVAVVHDVELVVIPKRRQQVLSLPGFEPSVEARAALPSGLVDELDEYLNGVIRVAAVAKRRDRNGRTFWGPSDKRILWPLVDGGSVAVDMFGATPTTFGAKLALRTGPWQLSKLLVTPRARGGLMPDDCEFRAGGLYRFDTQTNARFRTFVPTPDEPTLFAELGLPDVTPEHRLATTFDRQHAGDRR